MRPPSTLSRNDVVRAEAELTEHRQVYMEDKRQAGELARRLPREGRPYFVRGRRVFLGTSSRDRGGSTASRS